MTIQIKSTDKNSFRQDLKRDTTLSVLSNKTPQQIESYIDANVTDLSSAKEFIKKLTKVIILILKKEGF